MHEVVSSRLNVSAVEVARFRGAFESTVRGAADIGDESCRRGQQEASFFARLHVCQPPRENHEGFLRYVLGAVRSGQEPPRYPPDLSVMRAQ